MEPSSPDAAWKRLRSALEELVDMPAAERAAAVARLAAGSSELRAELERLLPTLDSGPDLSAPTGITSTSSANGIGRRIGPWVLQRQLGEGGMGAVFEARRESGGFQQRVALKLVRRGLDTDQVLRRFERERALLARLVHEGIAQLHDGGATEEGVPWFAMELVEGEPIDRYCARERLDARGRVELFLRVAGAVQHAHAHLVVHRDLKPSNILVTRAGAPKLLDFGIAKALQEDDAGDPTLTSTGERVLTPLYASPEQWRGESATTASDVFALGVILYQLLSGEVPRTREELTRLEREVEWPPVERPSVRAARATDSTRVGVDSRALSRQVEHDLDWIVLKALQTDPARRYLTVESLAADLSRWLAGRPVEARPDSVTYRAKSYVRRNRLVVGATAMVTIGLAAGLVAALVAWHDADVASGIATAAQLRAQGETAKLLQLAARQELADLETEAGALWPLAPELLPRIESWTRRAQALVAEEPKHATTFSELTAQSDAGPETEERRWWRLQVEAHLSDLHRFTDPRRGVFVDATNPAGVGVLRRKALIEGAITGPTDRARSALTWDEARDYVRRHAEYGGLELPPLFGLVPLGPDPASRLMEFTNVLTGDPAQRGEDGRIRVVPEMGIVLVLVPGGEFTFGAQKRDPDKPNYDPDTVASLESPTWNVRLSPFLVSKYEVTRAQWMRLTGRDSSSRMVGAPGEADDLLRPIDLVSWDECHVVLDRYGLVLPTEVQWEYVARGGTHTPWWCGSQRETLAEAENLYDLDGDAKLKYTTSQAEPWHDGAVLSSRAGRFPANPFGLHDALGSLSEWCLDHPGRGDVEPAAGRGMRVTPSTLRAVRGGNYRTSAARSRASYRITTAPGTTAETVGVRPAMLVVEDGPRWGP